MGGGHVGAVSLHRVHRDGNYHYVFVSMSMTESYVGAESGQNGGNSHVAYGPRS